MTMTLTRRGAVAGLASLPLLGLSLGRVAPASAAPAPKGYLKYLVYMMNGVVDPNDTSGVPTGDFYQREIMQRTTNQIAAEYTRAEHFFLERFGLDFAAVDAVDGIKTVGTATLDPRGFMVDPRNAYRVYTISGVTVPDEGWPVRDGGWTVRIGDGGATLHGEWGGADGIAVPEGAAFFFGDYNIATGADPLVIHYQSNAPMVPSATGVRAFSCQVFHPDWGWGLANGVSLPPEDLGDGTVKLAVRNVLTFPGR